MLSFSINSGINGAKNEEYISCSKCAAEISATLENWNFVVFNGLSFSLQFYNFLM